MAVRQILKLGHPKLYVESETVADIYSPIISDLLQDMRDTMHALDGAGIAAPQIGVNLRVIMFGIESNPRYPDVAPIPMTVLFNPSYRPLSENSEDIEYDWEGCLSVPNMRGKVPRYRNISYTALDENGAEIEKSASGFHARVIQHEIDHLDGILYIQRMTDISDLGFEQELFPYE